MTNKSPSLSSLNIKITILQGRNLVAKDRALFGIGKKNASDPYVRVFFGGKIHGRTQAGRSLRIDQTIERGRTETQYKTLNPHWRRGIVKISLNSQMANDLISGKDPSLAKIKLLIFDEDQVSEDDDMGTVVIPLRPLLGQPPEAKWYSVEKGKGEHHVKNATGELQVKVEVSGKKVLSLTKGNVYNIPGGKLRVGLGWQLEGRKSKRGMGTDLDISCVAIDYQGHIRMDETVYYGDLENSNRSILHSGDELTGEEDLQGSGDDEVITCDLDRICPYVLGLYFIATVATAGKTFANVTSALVRVTDKRTGALMCNIVPSLAGESTALFLFRLARDTRNRCWALSVIGEGHDTARDFGVLIPEIKNFSRDLVPHISVNPYERVALLSKGGAVRVRDFAGVSEGGKVPSEMTFGLAWDVTNGVNIDLDASVVCLSQNLGVVEIVYYGRLNSNNGSIRHGGDEREGDEKGDDEKIHLSLDKIPDNVEYIGFVINSYSGQELDDVSKASCHLFDSYTLEDRARYVMSNCKALDKHTALVVGCLYRDRSAFAKDEWCLWIISEAAQGKTVKDNLGDLRRALKHGPPKPILQPPIEEDIVFNPMPEPIPVADADIHVVPLHEMEDIYVQF
mmetsp:Transcript_28177/g.40815  ORF Transcript_28177/g.40815 Transcript_28177/m.40815 type:complete len:624 (+) Transcript_28177:142-2013(+)